MMAGIQSIVKVEVNAPQAVPPQELMALFGSSRMYVVEMMRSTIICRVDMILPSVERIGYPLEMGRAVVRGPCVTRMDPWMGWDATRH
jgi:hypothetical protein